MQEASKPQKEETELERLHRDRPSLDELVERGALRPREVHTPKNRRRRSRSNM